MQPPTPLLKNILSSMSIDFLQGLFSVRLKDFDIFKEIGTFSNLKELDFKARQAVLSKFPLNQESVDYLKKDIFFHQKTIRQLSQDDQKKFLQAIFLPFDAYKIELTQKGETPESLVGYYSLEEIKNIIKTAENKKFISTEGSLVDHLLNLIINKDNFSKKDLFDLRFKFLLANNFNFIRYYLEIEFAADCGKINTLKQKLPFNLDDIIKDMNVYDFDLLKFYLPLILKKSFVYLSDPYEFIFFYFQRRFMLWKIINPYFV
jgi:hypothetical protein